MPNRTAFINTGAYILVVLPAAITVSFFPVPNTKFLAGIHVLTDLIFWSVCSVDPLIYFFSNEFYRKAFKKTFRISENQQILTDMFRPSSRQDNTVESVAMSTSMQQKKMKKKPGCFWQ